MIALFEFHGARVEERPLQSDPMTFIRSDRSGYNSRKKLPYRNRVLLTGPVNDTCKRWVIPLSLRQRSIRHRVHPVFPFIMGKNNLHRFYNTTNLLIGGVR